VSRTTLDEILASTRARLPDLRTRRPALERAAAGVAEPPSWAAALRRPDVALIAEVKRRSPSAGVIHASLDPPVHAAEYARGGAAAVSVLTDGPFFGGSLDDLAAVTGAISIPVLRKDFILDELQLVEARGAGASAVLLIVRALDPRRLRALAQAAHGMGLATLVEVHTDAELEVALGAEPTTIGVNSRDLRTLAVSTTIFEELAPALPSQIPWVAESGIRTPADVERLRGLGYRACLIGERFMTAPDPGEAQAAFAKSSAIGHKP